MLRGGKLPLMAVLLMLLAWEALAIESAGADEKVKVCFNYGCLAQAEVVFSNAQLSDLAQLMRSARTAEEERQALGEAIGRLLGWAGQQSPIAADRGGNYLDDAIYGRMDCIDHATTTTRLLSMMERHGMLRFHRLDEPVLRRRFLLFEHYSALIKEVSGDSSEVDAGRYVVDSWFFDNGQPAAVMPLASWQKGESPNGVE